MADVGYRRYSGRSRKRRAACYTNCRLLVFRNNHVKHQAEGGKKLRKKSVPVETVQLMWTGDGARDAQR